MKMEELLPQKVYWFTLGCVGTPLREIILFFLLRGWGGGLSSGQDCH